MPDAFIMHRHFAFLSAAWLALPAQAQTIEVDLELVLMVDVSRSMTQNELEIQRQGYAAALRSARVYAAVRSGLLQKVALSYVEWAGSQNVIIDWTVIESQEDLNGFADTLLNSFTIGQRRTSISEALSFGAEFIQSNSYEGMRKVIDISGDGPNNQGRPVAPTRDAVVADGIVINGLPLMTKEGMGTQWHLDNLDYYYETCVIGGPGSFVIPVLNWEDFAEAVRRKLVLEIASLPMTEVVQPIQYALRDPSDCLVGEKIWEQRRMDWAQP